MVLLCFVGSDGYGLGGPLDGVGCRTGCVRDVSGKCPGVKGRGKAAVRGCRVPQSVCGMCPRVFGRGGRGMKKYPRLWRRAQVEDDGCKSVTWRQFPVEWDVTTLKERTSLTSVGRLGFPLGAARFI